MKKNNFCKNCKYYIPKAIFLDKIVDLCCKSNKFLDISESKIHDYRVYRDLFETQKFSILGCESEGFFPYPINDIPEECIYKMERELLK